MNDPINNMPDYDGIGVYALIAENGKRYIGSSKNVKRRVKEHNSAIKGHYDLNALLDHTFVCEVIEKLPYGITPLELVRKEEEVINRYQKSELLNSVYFRNIHTSNKKTENIPIAKPTANRRGDTMSTLGCKVTKEQAQAFKEHCQSKGSTANKVLRDFVLDSIGSSKPAPSGTESEDKSE